MSSFLVILLFGVVKQFCRFWIGQKQSVKLAEYDLQDKSTPPPPHIHTLSVFTVHLVREGGGGRSERR